MRRFTIRSIARREEDLSREYWDATDFTSVSVGRDTEVSRRGSLCSPGEGDAFVQPIRSMM